MMMRITVRMLSAAALALAICAWSGSASAQQQASASAQALARQLLELKNAMSIYQGSVPGMVDRVKNQLIQNNITYQKDLTELAAKFNQDMQGRDAEIGNEMVRLYTTDFTEQELKDLVAFYKSPLGKKYLEQEPKTIQASLKYMNDWAQRFGDEIDAKFHEEMKKRGKMIN
jgi:uncharacterized protein